MSNPIAKAFQRLLDWLRGLFWKEELELTLVGLQYSGKTTFVSVIAVSSILVLCDFHLFDRASFVPHNRRDNTPRT